MASYELDVNINVNNTEELEEVSAKLQQTSDDAEKTGESVDSLGQKSEEAGDKVSGLGDSSGNSAGEINILGDAIAGVTSLGLAAEFNNTAMAADKYNVSMAALNQVASNNNINLNGVSSAIQKVTDTTSISGGQARNYFSMLMNLGVTNTNALSESMINLKGQSAITGGSIEQMSSKLTTIVNGTAISARSLTSLGLSLQQLASTNGMSVDEIKSKWSTMTADQKIQALNNAMSRNTGLVSTMNQTTGEQLQEVKNSWAGLEISVGQSTTGASQFIFGLTNGAIQGLNNAVKNIPFASSIAGGVLAFGSLATGAKPALDTFNSLSMTVKNTGGAISTVTGIMSSAKGIIDTLRNAESLRAGVVAVLSGAEGAHTLAEASDTAAKSAGIGPTIALAIANNSLLLPILLVTAAVIAIIAVLWYLYNTNTSVRNAINGVINVFRVIASVIMGAVRNAFSTIMGVFNRVKGVISSIFSALSPLTSAWHSLSGAVSTALGPLQSVWNTLSGIAGTIKSVGLGALMSVFQGVSFEGFQGVSYEGFNSNDSLNSTIQEAVLSNDSKVTINTTNNLNGIFENDAKEWVIETIDEKITKENLIRGRV